MGIYRHQLREDIIRYTLQDVGLWSPEAEELLMGTAAHETQLGKFVKQLRTGPAVGIFQIEPRSYLWVCSHHARPSKPLNPTIQAMLRSKYNFDIHSPPPARRLTYDMALATIVARLYYMMFSEALPAADDLPAQARYWKKYWNTYKGAGTVDQYIDDYNRLVLRR